MNGKKLDTPVSITGTEPSQQRCETSWQVFSVLEEDKYFVLKKIEQIFMHPTLKDSSFVLKDSETFYNNLLNSPDLYTNFVQFLIDNNIILTDTKFDETVKPEVLLGVADILKSDNPENDKILQDTHKKQLLGNDSTTSLIIQTYQHVSPELDFLKGVEGIKMVPSYSYDAFVGRVSTMKNGGEIRSLVQLHRNLLVNMKNENPGVFVELVKELMKTDGGGYAIRAMVEQGIFTKDDKKTLKPLLSDLAKTDGGGRAIYVMVGKEIFTNTEEDKKTLKLLLLDLAKTDGGGLAIYVMVGKEIFTNTEEDKKTLKLLLLDLAQTDGGGLAINTMVGKDIFTDKEIESLES